MASQIVGEPLVGDQRLVGHVSWLNTARTFDGARVTLRGKALQLDAFGASVVRIMDDEFDKSGNGNKFFGAYATAPTLVPKSSVEPYVFWRGDRNLKSELGPSGDLAATTIGAAWCQTTARLACRWIWSASSQRSGRWTCSNARRPTSATSPTTHARTSGAS